MYTNLVSIGDYHSSLLSLTTEGHDMGPGHYEAIITRTASKENLSLEISFSYNGHVYSMQRNLCPIARASRFHNWGSEFCS